MTKPDLMNLMFQILIKAWEKECPKRKPPCNFMVEATERLAMEVMKRSKPKHR